jgi:hypothetical protein
MAWNVFWRRFAFVVAAVVVPVLLAACPSNSGGGY